MRRWNVQTYNPPPDMFSSDTCLPPWRKLLSRILHPEVDVTYLPYRVSGSTLTAVGRFQLLARWPETHSPDFIRDATSSTDCFRRLLKTYLFARN